MFRRFILGICLVVLFFIAYPVRQVTAATYPYATDPRDGATIMYFTTTTNSITLTIGSLYFYGSPDWPPFEIRYYDGEYYTTVFSTASSNSSRKWASHSMTGLNPGQTYTFNINGYTNLRVSESNGDGYNITINGPWSFTTEMVTPGVPTFDNITPNSVYVSWTSNGNGTATKYTLQRSSSPTGPWSNLVVDTTTMHFQDSGLSSNTTYYYRVVGKTPVQSLSSAVVSLTTATDPTIAAATAAKVSADQAICHRAAQYIDF